jgi:hypothetical protein
MATSEWEHFLLQGVYAQIEDRCADVGRYGWRIVHEDTRRAIGADGSFEISYRGRVLDSPVFWFDFG